MVTVGNGQRSMANVLLQREFRVLFFLLIYSYRYFVFDTYVSTYVKYVNFAFSLSLSPCAAIRKEMDEIEEGKYTTENNVLKVTVL